MEKVVVILGTNASGKSSLGIELAQKFNGEILSADSRQVYENFDLCCGKVNAEERAMIPHHILDVRTIGNQYTAYDFQKDCYTLIPDIIKRGKTPFIVGGTGLYIEAVANGYEFTDDKLDSTLRESLDNMTLDELYTELNKCNIDKSILNESDVHNKRRIIRLIEKTKANKSLNKKANPKFEILKLGVTWDKETLHKRIDERLDTRIEEGMIDEIKDYLANGGSEQYLIDLGLEYKYTLKYVKGEYKTLDEFKEEMSKAIKRFTKNQVTWFKRDKDIIWLDMTNKPLEEASKIIEKFLAK